MLRASRLAPLRLGNRPPPKSVLLCATFNSSISRSSSLPNDPMYLDPSFQRLLQDVDISLKRHKLQPVPPHRELEVISSESTSIVHQIKAEEWAAMEAAIETSLDEEADDHEHRKSPAAAFGSNQIGTVILPLELQSAINLLIAEGEKSEIRSDAMRLFAAPGTNGKSETDWDAQYDKVYRSRVQAARHSERDGTAFATVALPAHYSAITSVLHHLKQRVDPSWEVKNSLIGVQAPAVVYGRASLHSFQNKVENATDITNDKTVVASTIKSYLGLDKREGLVAIGERLVASTSIGNLNVQWKKTFKEEHKVLREEGSKTIALSAFMLTSLPTSVAQKTLVQEMWDSGAHTIVIIDHNTKEGFQAVAHAREFILGLGKAELEDPENAPLDILGSHVVAPCPHDHACPLLHSGGAPLICGFSQRIQRPEFVRRTKHSGVGHEDIGYSYVVIQRGPRPVGVTTNVGRVGAIGKRVLKKELEAAIPMKELQLHVEETTMVSESEVETLTPRTAITYEGDNLSHSDLHTLLRQEAYRWPRLVFPPLKKSGHIILDSCTAEGKIMRLTIPKSQGKQPFYDARKSSWGDIFPHPPKNQALERNQPKLRSRKKDGPVTGADIGKRKDLFKNKERPSYSAVADNVRENKKRSKREFALTRGNKVWKD
ncbi:mitochondrial small ribosomal subunit Rsm22-domain-containing protein [Flammula alnicola]|nr:mitochondrial small ribosomal subunit Rsm22-domain-containing protein [Flammula alnicola]